MGERDALLRSGNGRTCNSVSNTFVNLSELPVYSTIHDVHRQIIEYVDVPLSEEQLKSPEIQFAIIQPLESSLGELNDPSIVYVLLVNRLEFIRQRDSALSSSSLNETRAYLCETLAIRLLRHQATLAKGPGGGLLAMSRALVGGLNAFQGCPDKVLHRIKQHEGSVERVLQADGAAKTNALELAILGKARLFIKSQATQRVINAIWEGRVVYSSSSFLDILPDKWKVQEIGLYNIKNAPILDHYRLRVPKYRSIIDFFSFLVLFISFLFVVLDHQRRPETMPVSSLSAHEVWFFVYSLGYSLDKVASIMEHGWSVFSAGLTNGLDSLCVPFFVVGFIFRIHSIFTNDMWASDQAFAIISCAACFMFPRLAFAAISNNVLILSLRAMLADFAWLMGIAVFCFLGFVFALSHLCDGEYSVARIAEWLIFIWFGLDGTGIELSPTFHPWLGPALIVSYAALSNTLLVSLLVAILSGTYSGIAADAAAEDMFRKAVMTFEGVKCDSLFDYVPPLNLIALCIMWPISRIASPRWFHKINVAATRTFSLPILLMIALYERQALPTSPIRKYLSQSRLRLNSALPQKWARKLSLLEGAHWECEAVFEYCPDEDEKDEEEEDDFMEEDDEVEDSVRAAESKPRICLSSRASYIISSTGGSRSTTPQLPPQPIIVKSPEPSSSSIPASVSASRQSTPIAPERTQPARIQTHERQRSGRLLFENSTHERLPRNSMTYGSTGHHSERGRSKSPDRASESPLSSSAPTTARFESPLAKLYHQGDDGQPGGMRRRMSVSGMRAHASEPSQDALKQMITDLATSLARLETKLDDKFRSRDGSDNEDDEEAIL